MELFNNYVTSRGVVLIGSVHTNAFSYKNADNYMGFYTLDAFKCARFHLKKHKHGCYYREAYLYGSSTRFHDSDLDPGVVGGSKKAIFMSLNYFNPLRVILLK